MITEHQRTQILTMLEDVEMEIIRLCKELLSDQMHLGSGTYRPPILDKDEAAELQDRLTNAVKQVVQDF